MFTGTAPASEDRIPARVKSQDNGVLYTSLGFVSAKNIYNLFDRQTDIMIQFPGESDLTRHTADNTLMDLIIPIVDGAEIALIPEYYTEEIGLARYQETEFKPVYKPIPKRFSRAPTGWCSWYAYYMSATQEDMVRETDALARYLKQYGLEYVQLDACYTRGEEASYLTWTKKTFPEGGKWLFQYIKDKGLKPGLWLNAYGANYAHPECAEKYPENFFLRDENGNLSGACCTADDTVVRLDYTNPDVIEQHLKPLFKTLVEDWGLTYLKDAGWGTWMDYYEVNKERAYNPSIDSREAYLSPQRVIRDIMGPDNYINGCAMHEVGIGFGYFDGSRTGGDDYASWYHPTKGKDGSGRSMQVFFNSLFGANYLNGIVWWSDPDVVMVREPLTMDEGKTIVSSIALTGQTYMINDFIAELSEERVQRVLTQTSWGRQYPNLIKKLPEERLELYRKTLPTVPITAMDLYPFRSEPIVNRGLFDYPKVLDLKVNAVSGVYDVVAVYNWSDEPAIKTVSFGDDLGLDTEKKYLIFDFWNQKLEGIFKDNIQVEVPTHGTRVFMIRLLTDSPQLLATSRHITGAFSIKELVWHSSEFTLNGISQTIPDVPYSLFFHVPEGVTLAEVNANTRVLFNRITDNLLEVAFQGQETPITWSLQFQS